MRERAPGSRHPGQDRGEGGQDGRKGSQDAGSGRQDRRKGRQDRRHPGQGRDQGSQNRDSEGKIAAILAVELSILVRMESILGVDAFLPAYWPCVLTGGAGRFG
jgi:hypothetical protein